MSDLTLDPKTNECINQLPSVWIRGSQVRFLIYYDSSMTDYISGLADFLIEITNDAFSDSGVDLSLEPLA